MVALAVVMIILGIVLIEALVMARQELIRLRDIVDQLAAEEHDDSTLTDDEYAQRWARIR